MKMWQLIKDFPSFWMQKHVEYMKSTNKMSDFSFEIHWLSTMFWYMLFLAGIVYIVSLFPYILFILIGAPVCLILYHTGKVIKEYLS